jgi:hypothetical protein
MTTPGKDALAAIQQSLKAIASEIDKISQTINNIVEQEYHTHSSDYR